MPAKIRKTGEKVLWERAKALASSRGYGKKISYVTAIFQKLKDVHKAITNKDFTAHTRSGKKIPMPPDNICTVDTEKLGKQLADRLSSWDEADHEDASAAHMMAGIAARDDSLGKNEHDIKGPFKLARQHILMGRAHGAAMLHAKKKHPEGQMPLSKSHTGAGTRGGNIVSFTSSGKAVYAPGHGHQVGYTATDHHEAAKAHLDAAKRLVEAKKTAKTANAAGRLRTKAGKHIDLAQAHLEAVQQLSAAVHPAPPPTPAPPPEPPAEPEKPAAEAEKPALPTRKHKYVSRERGPDGKWVYTYADDGKPKKPRKAKLEPEPEKTPEPPIETKAAPPPEKDPDREEAAAALKEPGEYDFARDSKFGNKGEDLKLSARHKVNAWKSWEQAEKEGTAKELVKRDVLMKVKPLDFMGTVERGKPLTAMVAYLALRKFPAAPTHKGVGRTVGKQAADDTPIADVFENEAGHKRVVYRHYQRDRENPTGPYGFSKHVETLTKDTMEARNRGEFVAAFDRVQAAAKEVMEKSTDDNWSLVPMREAASSIMNDLRQVDRYSDTANQLVRYINNSLQTDRYRPKANSVQDDLKKLQEGLGNVPEEQRPAALLEVIKKTIEGKSVAGALDKESQKKGSKVVKPKEYTAADAYLGKATRKGPELANAETKAQQEKTLLDTMELRGLQWGNSVTDDERKHHLKQVTMAFDDLADVLGLPKKMVSFNGRLGMAIGARGHGGAMAHYEPSMRVINITRKNGVGTVAHEWGHFFDNICSELVAKKRDGYLTDEAKNVSWKGVPKTDHPVVQAMTDLFLSSEMQGFQQRLRDVLVSPAYIDRITPGKRKYWTSTIEVWARCFERHVQVKLGEKGRENTYLSGGTNRDLWPNDAESAALAPLFDKVFEAFKSTDLVTKAMILAA